MRAMVVAIAIAAPVRAQPGPVEPRDASEQPTRAESEPAPNGEAARMAPGAESAGAAPPAWDLDAPLARCEPVDDDVVSRWPAHAQGVARDWSVGTAHTLPEGRVEVGLFQPLRVGVQPDLELSTHPLLDLVAPNLALKKAWARLGDSQWLVSSRHRLWYPSGLLTLVAREGVGGILPEETRVPHIVLVTNEVLFSVPAFRHTFTAKAGVTVAATFGRSTLRSIDLPLVYPRLAAVFAPVSFVAGADLDGELPGPFAYTVDVDVFVNTDDAAPFAIEHAGLATWRATDSLLVQAGYKLIFGSYPGGPDGFRTQWHILPLADLVWAF